MSAPPGALGVVVWVLAALAALVVAGVCVGMAVVRDLPGRLHLVTPLTSVAAPAIGLACALTLGPSTSAAGVVVVTVLLAVTAPVLQSAIARAARDEHEADPVGDGAAP